MLKKLMNSALIATTAVFLSSFWDFHLGYGSLILFGEPDYPDYLSDVAED